MKKIIYIIFLSILVINVRSQDIPPTGCNQSTSAVNTIFYPNTTTNITSTVTNLHGMYLCGSNTVVYDTTVTNAGCRFAYISASSTLISSSQTCVLFDSYFVKSGGTMIIKSNANWGGFNVYFEPGATIIDYAGVQTYSCASIPFPNVNCIPQGINKLRFEGNEILIYPNPIKDKLSLDFEQKNIEHIVILNCLGQVIYSIEKPMPKQEFDLSFLSSGVYYLKAQNNSGQRTFKLIKE